MDQVTSRRRRRRRLKQKNPSPRKPRRAIHEEELDALIKDDETLVVADQLIDWEPFRDKINATYHDRMGQPIKNHGIRMFKALTLKGMYGWSDEQTWHHINHNYLYRKFVGYSPTEPIFEASALPYFRKRLIDHDLYFPLFGELNRQLVEQGFIREDETLFIDATLMKSKMSTLTVTQFIQVGIKEIFRRLEHHDAPVHHKLMKEFPTHFDYILGTRENTFAFLDPMDRTRSLESLVIDAHILMGFLDDFELSEETTLSIDLLVLFIAQHIEYEELEDPTRRPGEKNKRYRVNARRPVPAGENGEGSEAESDDRGEEEIVDESNQEDVGPTKPQSSGGKTFHTLSNAAGVQIKSNDDLRKEGARRPVSPLDPDAEFGRGSKGISVGGYMMEWLVTLSGFITSLRVYSASMAEGLYHNVLWMLSWMKETFDYVPHRLAGDQAYGSALFVHILNMWGVEVVAKPQFQRVALEGIFDVDRDNLTATCMGGRRIPLQIYSGDPNLLEGSFRLNKPFSADSEEERGCLWCPWWDGCGGEVKVRIRKVFFPASHHVAELISAMHDLDHPNWEILKQRCHTVEPKIGEFKSAGWERTDFVGVKAVECMATIRAMGLNMKRAARLRVSERRLALEEENPVRLGESRGARAGERAACVAGALNGVAAASLAGLSCAAT